VVTDAAKHCAAAMIIVEHEGRANQMMRIGGLLGLYRPEGFWMGAPVFVSLSDWVDAHR
jgi:hypothetical protein